LSPVRGVNKTDAATLCGAFSSLREVLNAPTASLARCPGLGPAKVRRLHAAFGRPFGQTAAASQDAVDRAAAEESARKRATEPKQRKKRASAAGSSSSSSSSDSSSSPDDTERNDNANDSAAKHKTDDGSPSAKSPHDPSEIKPEPAASGKRRRGIDVDSPPIVIDLDGPVEPATAPRNANVNDVDD
jgi:hypothetical protein